MLICSLLSVVFYYAINPFFEDFPLTPIKNNPFWVGIIRLSIRGLFVALMIVPLIFLVEQQIRIQNAKLEREKERLKESEEQNLRLETMVTERTKVLEQTLTSLHHSQNELDNHLYLLSRLVVSIAHDVKAPLNFSVLVSEKIQQMLSENKTADIEDYVQELTKSLTGMSVFMHNLLEFTKTQIQKETIHLSEVNLFQLAQEKIMLFEGIVESKKNTLSVSIPPQLIVNTNYNLLAVLLHNLIDNATRYTEHNAITITTDSGERKLHLVIQNTIPEVTDSIMGIMSLYGKPGNRPVIPTHDEGKGVGLLLVKDIAALLNINFYTTIESDQLRAHLVFNEPTEKGTPAPASTNTTDSRRDGQA